MLGIRGGRWGDRTGVFGSPSVFIPLKKIPTARFRAQLLSPVVPIVPSERPWVGQTLQPRIAPPRPTDATHPPSIAGGAAELALVCG